MHIRVEYIKKTALVLVGSGIAAVGLQFFLLPNHLMDGGVTGLAIIAAKLFSLSMAPFLVLFNIPFIILGYKKFGKEFALLSIVGVMMLALLTVVHMKHGFTDVPFLAAVFGGLFVGIGVGFVVRYGGIIDGLDVVAVLIDRVTVFSVGEAIMAINGVIITLAGFVFGWEQALYSLVAYFVAHKAIDVTVEGLDASRCVWVVSNDIRTVGRTINMLIQEPVTYLKESNRKDKEPHGILLVAVTRMQEQRVKQAIRLADPRAFIVVTSAQEVIGKLPETVLPPNAVARYVS